VYNASKFISGVLECVASQDLVVCEHILVDDCSQDNSYALLCEAALNYPNIKVARLPKNSGPIAARNEAIKMASGKYLAFLDADDYWMPNKLATQVTFMEKNDVALSFTDYRHISENGALIGRLISGLNKINWELHHITRYIGCLTVVINREKCPDFLFKGIGKSSRGEDFLAWSEVIKKYGPALRCPHDLARYRDVLNSRSSNIMNSISSMFNIYRYVENISLVKLVPYFICYVFFATIKKLWARPFLLSSSIDGELAKKYCLANKK
jgi:glycosyltransferase involved in cell wall biosynthesis